MRKAWLAALCAAVLSTSAFADVVTLSNGDKITGTILELNPKNVIVETPYAGKIVVDRIAVKTLLSAGKVTIIDGQGSTANEFLTPLASGTGWQTAASAMPVQTPPTTTTAPATAPGTVTVAPVAVAAAPLPEGRKTAFLYLGPNWKNQFAIGAVNTTGNDETTSVDVALSLNYAKKAEELNIKFEGVYGTSNGTQTAALAYEDAVYRHELNKKWYVYADDDVRYDGIKGISLEADASVGVGYYLFRGDKFSLDFRAGPGVTYLKTFDGETSTDPAVKAGVRASYKFNERVNATHETSYTTAVSDDFKNYRVHSETALEFKLDLERGLGLKLAYADDYENQPSAGKKRNDTRVTLALTFDF